MPPDKFFAYAADLLKLHPPHITDQPIIARLERIGFEVGKSFDLNAADPAIQKGLDSAPQAAQKLMAWKFPTMARVANGWSMNTDTMGVYGNYYLKRAMIAQVGTWWPTCRRTRSIPSIWPTSKGNPLTGANTYTIHFDKGEAPPAQAFWSITLYDPAGFQVANSINRFAVSSWMPLKYNPDGSLDLYFQNESPGADNEANWLPRTKRALQFDDADLCAKERCDHRQMGPAARSEGADRSCRSSIAQSRHAQCADERLLLGASRT